MATATMIPLEEYLQTVYEPDAEWIDGEIKERSVGEGSHGVVQTFFIKYFLLREEHLGVRVTQEVRTQVAASRFRVPDVMLVRSSDPFEEIVTVAPLLCIEVLSPDDRMTAMQDKIDDYLAMGVRTVWVIDPLRRRAFMAEGGALIPVQQFTVPGTEIGVPVAEVFADLDRVSQRS